MKLDELSLDELELRYEQMKVALGSKLAEQRQLAGFPKTSYHGGRKSANILFNTESGANLPNIDTLEYYIDLYQVREKVADGLRDLHAQAKETKKMIIRKKRGWS